MLLMSSFFTDPFYTSLQVVSCAADQTAAGHTCGAVPLLKACPGQRAPTGTAVPQLAEPGSGHRQRGGSAMSKIAHRERERIFL